MTLVVIYIRNWSTDYGVSEFITTIVIIFYIATIVGIAYFTFRGIMKLTESVVDDSSVIQFITENYRCPQCQKEIDLDASYCSSCGFDLQTEI